MNNKMYPNNNNNNSIPTTKNYGALLEQKPNEKCSFLKTIINIIISIGMIIISGIFLCIKNYCKCLKWTCTRPSILARICWFTVAIITSIAALLGIFGIISSSFSLGNDPCEVQREWINKINNEILDNHDETSSVDLSTTEKLQLPKIFHQQWKTSNIPTDSELYQYRQKFLQLFSIPDLKNNNDDDDDEDDNDNNNNFQSILWTDITMRKLIQDKFDWFLPCFDGYAHPIQRVDASRYFILYTYGGLYADLDYEPLQNFWSFLPNDRPGFIESPYKYNERVQNSLMSSPPKHEIWNITFQVLLERCKRTDVLTSTGPSMVDEVLRRAEKAHVPFYELPCENFHRIPVGAQVGKSSPFLTYIVREFVSRTPLVKQCGDVASNDECQYGIHHNAATWLGSSFF
jgi:mannosyltransferase OCH1-like enzyme